MSVGYGLNGGDSTDKEEEMDVIVINNTGQERIIYTPMHEEILTGVLLHM